MFADILAGICVERILSIQIRFRQTKRLPAPTAPLRHLLPGHLNLSIRENLHITPNTLDQEISVFEQLGTVRSARQDPPFACLPLTMGRSRDLVQSALIQSHVSESGDYNDIGIKLVYTRYVFLEQRCLLARCIDEKKFPTPFTVVATNQVSITHSETHTKRGQIDFARQPIQLSAAERSFFLVADPSNFVVPGTPVEFIIEEPVSEVALRMP